MKIAIVGSMLNELWTLKHAMQIESQEYIAGRQYIDGSLFGKSITLVYSKCGKVSAAITTTTLIVKYKVDFVFFLGVAGALHNDLTIGDIIIADELFQYDMDARPIFPRYEVPFTNKSIYSPKKHDIENIKIACDYFVGQLASYISSETLENYHLTKPKVYIGQIATGDQFLTDKNKRDILIQDNKNLLAVEMEGAAIAQTCEEHDIPYLILRIISDNADDAAANDYQNFVTEIASYYAIGIIKKYFELN